MPAVPPQGGRKHPHQELIQIDTTNILFICGGAFDGIEKIIESRYDTRIHWIWRRVLSVKEERNVGEILKEVMPEDSYQIRTDSGIYRTCSGGSYHWMQLDEKALISILKEPKNVSDKAVP